MPRPLLSILFIAITLATSATAAFASNSPHNEMVELDSFWIDRTEVSISQLAALPMAHPALGTWKRIE